MGVDAWTTLDVVVAFTVGLTVGFTVGVTLGPVLQSA